MQMANKEQVSQRGSGEWEEGRFGCVCVYVCVESAVLSGSSVISFYSVTIDKKNIKTKKKSLFGLDDVYIVYISFCHCSLV